MQVTKRWRSVRDSFRKHQLKKARSGSGGDTGATYKYYNQLLFLLSSRELRRTSSNVDFQSEDEVVEGANTTPEEQNITTTDDPQVSGDEEEVEIPISQPASEQPIEMSQSQEIVEDSDVPGPSGVQPSRLTPPDLRRIPLLTRRATARAALRRRLRPEHDLNEEIISLIHRQRSEDGSDAFGQAIAERLRTLPVQQRTRCMSFMLGCIDYFDEPYVAPPIPTLLSYMMERCSPPTTRNAERSQLDSSTQTEWQKSPYGNRPLVQRYLPQEQY
ncbi:uncharacterized protein LOC130304665 [Hyla sarda]|uniref:uncharacterized protein LOC130304665 n=1 Tax=Hyla sarda TaxID=327740 RepID=UPI0024C4725E|nr:uncharacterized protein LOC130304665 [Hyla sarda]